MRGAVVTCVRALACVSLTGLQIAAGRTGLAQAADHGDLDERVAELEQSVARTGGRQLQLKMYGQIDRAFLFWNDGLDSGTYGVDNHTSSSRFAFVGQAVIKPGWSAGYRLEIETPFPSSDEVLPLRRRGGLHA